MNLAVLTGITEQPTVHVSLYPNPTQGQLSFSIGDFTPQTITITSLDGQPVWQGAYSPQITISQLPAGIYTLELRGAQSLAKARVVKMN